MWRAARNYISMGSPVKAIRRPGFWLILFLLVLITIPHYEEAVALPSFINYLSSSLNLTRHTFERILYLAPIVWAGFMFGSRGALMTSLVAMVCMLPRAIFLSSSVLDAVFETSAIFIVGNVLAISFNALRREREHRVRLEVAQEELRASEHSYRRLFENAHDAIWVQDMQGNIIEANQATTKLSGYGVSAVLHMNVKDFLTDDSLELARETRRKLLTGEALEGSYDQRVIRQDGTEAFIRLSSSILRSDGNPVGIQHIARDVTREKRMEENLHYYLKQVTRAQEEERKRISRELHDETVQGLVVLSRQLDSLSSKSDGLSEENRQRLEDLWRFTNNLMKGVRRLSQDLLPAALDRLGLLSALEWLASSVTEYSGIKTRIDVHGVGRRFSEEIELVLFRITQEALRNVWRHSQATEAEITVEFEHRKVSIMVKDNGKGFSLPDTISDLTRDSKLGLAGMEERARLVGGTLEVRSQPGKGTSVTIGLEV